MDEDHAILLREPLRLSINPRGLLKVLIHEVRSEHLLKELPHLEVVRWTTNSRVLENGKREISWTPEIKLVGADGFSWTPLSTEMMAEKDPEDATATLTIT